MTTPALHSARPSFPRIARGARAWKRKGPAASYSRTGESRTTLGDGALDFRVRNGNGYDSPSVATGPKAGSSGTRENHNATGPRGTLRVKCSR